MNVTYFSQIALHNVGAADVKVVTETIKHMREIRTQSFNEYRKRFYLPPLKSIDEISGKLCLACFPWGHPLQFWQTSSQYVQVWRHH